MWAAERGHRNVLISGEVRQYLTISPLKVDAQKI